MTKKGTRLNPFVHSTWQFKKFKKKITRTMDFRFSDIEVFIKNE